MAVVLGADRPNAGAAGVFIDDFSADFSHNSPFGLAGRRHALGGVNDRRDKQGKENDRY